MRSFARVVAGVAAVTWGLLFFWNGLVLLDLAGSRGLTTGDAPFVLVPLAELAAALWVGFKASFTAAAAFVLAVILLALAAFSGLVVMASSGG